MWVAGIGRINGKLGLIYQGKYGTADFGTIENLRGEMPRKAPAKLLTPIQFNDHQMVPTSEYLAAIGAPGLSPEGQRCYEFQTAGGAVVIPSQLLVVALVGATTLMRAPLLSPQGPTALMTAYRDDYMTVMRVESTPKRMRRFQTDRWSTVCRMNWILKYPSAASAWSSVYVSALEGRLDIKLPQAEATVILRGAMDDGKLWATGMELLTLTANEAPHEFASSVGEESSCWCLATYASNNKHAPPARHGGKYHPMTDQQWNSLRGRLPTLGTLLGRKTRKHGVREKLDVIRLHLITGLSLYMLQVPLDLLRVTRAWVLKMKAKGAWPEIDAALKNTL